MYRQTKRPHTYNKSIFIFKVVLFLILSLVIGFMVIWAWYNRQITKPLNSSEEIVAINIAPGATRDQIASQLQDLGIIDNKNLFIWYLRVSGEGDAIKAGSHRFKKNINIKELVKSLESPAEENTVWVTVPEGLRYDEIAEIFAKEFNKYPENKFDKLRFLEISEKPHEANLSADARNFINKYLPEGKPIEGYLYPDTYNFFINTDTETVISKLVEIMAQKVKSYDKDIAKSTYSLYEIVNIASMLEREANNENEARMISDIIIRRLEMGYFLGIDATTLYELKDWKASLDNSSFEKSTAYNTRKIIGLPPTPICNPGITSIAAVISPIPNEYFYYLHDNSNQIHYGRNNAEHEQNKRKYLH